MHYNTPMSVRRRLWSNLREHLLTPKVSEPELEQCLRRLRSELPVPVFWLLGKTQSGKTSLIRALTGSTRAEIGNGFQPCTRTAELYSFPSVDECFVQFLDTRGLGEVEYDPTDDLGVIEDRAHLLIVVMKAMDHAQQSVLDPVRQILRAHPYWPLIVIQTALHEGYPTGTTQHVAPYPFDQEPWPDTVPTDLARSLASQRQLFEGYDAHFVPVDFTLPEDGFDVEHYGLDALWAAIEASLPLGLRGMLQEASEARRSLRDIYYRAARPHIMWYAVAAGGAAGLPLPLVDVPLVLAIQAKLCHALASIYGQPMNSRRMAEIGSALGMGFAVRLGGRELLKIIPGLGSAVSALYAGATTYALGQTLCAYFSHVQDGDVPDSAMLRRLFAAEYADGRRKLQAYFDTVKVRPGESVTPVAPQDQST